MCCFFFGAHGSLAAPAEMLAPENKKMIVSFDLAFPDDDVDYAAPPAQEIRRIHIVRALATYARVWDPAALEFAIPAGPADVVAGTLLIHQALMYLLKVRSAGDSGSDCDDDDDVYDDFSRGFSLSDADYGSDQSGAGPFGGAGSDAGDGKEDQA